MITERLTEELNIENWILQDQQLTRLAPFSWPDFVDFMQAERTGRCRTARRVSSTVEYRTVQYSTALYLIFNRDSRVFT